MASCSPKQLPKSTLFVVLDSKPNTLDPRKATDANGMRLTALIFNGLVKFGDQGELLPDAALKWELEGLTYTFYLKPDLSFSNGREVNKEDILFSFEEFKKKSSPFHSAFKNIKSVKVFEEKTDKALLAEPLFEDSDDSVSNKNLSEKSDEELVKNPNASLFKEPIGDLDKNSSGKSDKKNLIVKIAMNNFQAPFLYSDLQVIKILPKKEILESPEEFQKKPLGTGHFELVKNNFHQILLKRRDKSQAFSPRFISFQIIRDSFTRTQKILSGEADLAPSVIPLQKVAQFKRQKEKFRILFRSGLSTTYLLINLKNKFLKNNELRKALSLSVNREEIIKYKLQGYAVPASSFINPENYFFNKKIESSVFDLKEAKNIIRELGLQGLRLKLSTSNNQDTVNKARVLASQMSQTGLKITLQSNEWGTFYKDVGRGAYEIALMKWVGIVDPDIYRVAFHSENEAPRGRNRSFYKNDTLDELLEEGLKTRDQTKRKQIYDQIQLIIAQDFVVIPLWHDMELTVLKTNIANYQLRQNGDFLSLPLLKKK